MAFFAKALGEPALNYAKDQLINYAKSQLIAELQTKIQDGETGIENAFKTLKERLESFKVKVPVVDKEINVLQTIRDGICSDTKFADDVKQKLNSNIESLDFSKEIEEMKKTMPEEFKLEIDTLPEKLKTKLKTLIEEVITCNAVAVSAGGSKKKRRQKTKKRINKKSRGRKRHSRK